MSDIDADAFRGSLWHRWDPHIHAPGTAMNDQFSGPDPWREFFERVGRQDPPIRALGITDYFLIDTYENARAARDGGSLPGVDLVFPNVEIRLSIGTGSNAAVNAHLLFSPDDHDHAERIGRLLETFVFRYQKDQFRCERAELIRLGRMHDPTIVDDRAALTAGVNQFKIDFADLRGAWDSNEWFKANCLVAVAAGERDGTSGLRDATGSFDATRTEIEAFAHIIFSGNPKQAEFWLGKGVVKLPELNAKWNGVKPCLHGSDAHGHDKIGKPALDRLCWLKGAPTFETLRQACLNPEGRAFIGKEPPRGALPGNVIKSVSVSDAPWMSPSAIELNPGLIAIIGARGSGKTALADFVAMGGCAVSKHLSDKSFLRRAREHLGESTATLAWESGDETSNAFSSIEHEELIDAPHVQYLSQQFVDQLCSAEGLEDPLVREIERVVFDAHPEGDRLDATNFEELLGDRLRGAKSARSRNVDAIARISEAMTAEQARKDGLAAQIKSREEQAKAIAKDEADLRTLIPKGDEARAKRHEAVSQAVEAKRALVVKAKARLETLRFLSEDVDNHQQHVLPDLARGIRDERALAKLSEHEWAQFGIEFAGNVEAILEARIAEAKRAVSDLEGPAKAPGQDAAADPATPLVAESDDLSAHPLNLLERELARLQKLVGLDGQNARRYKQILEKVAKAKIALGKLDAEIEKGKGAADRIEALRLQRREAYVGVFESVVEEEKALAELYGPLKARIAEAAGSLAKLSFTVRREVDLKAWCAAGEELLDLRAAGAFKGVGSLRAAAELALGDAWRAGDAARAGEALTGFSTAYSAQLRIHKPAQADPKEWTRRVSAWLFSTDHISVRYGLAFDGVAIERLSPGTRGIVLLLLYLAVDSEDDRPLIIDQPEENLDPQSIYDELVQEFQRAKLRRQVIIVTHNANLVVNTDADQVIVARCGSHEPGRLPVMTYQSGGLEQPAIREAVCSILEGGKDAFRERARRLRVAL
jgi:energy-coupling factor transporter ATP-binding protein EcfA2